MGVAFSPQVIVPRQQLKGVIPTWGKMLHPPLAKAVGLNVPCNAGNKTESEIFEECHVRFENHFAERKTLAIRRRD